MEIKVTAPNVVRVKIGDWIVWVDNSTGERSISSYIDSEEGEE